MGISHELLVGLLRSRRFHRSKSVRRRVVRAARLRPASSSTRVRGAGVLDVVPRPVAADHDAVRRPHPEILPRSPEPAGRAFFCMRSFWRWFFSRIRKLVTIYINIYIIIFMANYGPLESEDPSPAGLSWALKREPRGCGPSPRWARRIVVHGARGTWHVAEDSSLRFTTPCRKAMIFGALRPDCPILSEPPMNDNLPEDLALATTSLDDDLDRADRRKVRYQVLAAACSLAVITYIHRVGFGTAAAELKTPLESERRAD